MIIILPCHIPVEVYNDLLDIYGTHEDHAQEWRDTKPLHTRDIKCREHRAVCQRVNAHLTNTVASIIGPNTYPELSQIVKWPQGSSQSAHFDVARESTTWTTVTYLNDDYGGGETFFPGEGLKIAPRRGTTILFNGKEYEHGVNEVKDYPRYSYSVWYTSDIMLYEETLIEGNLQYIPPPPSNEEIPGFHHRHG